VDGEPGSGGPGMGNRLRRFRVLDTASRGRGDREAVQPGEYRMSDQAPIIVICRDIPGDHIGGPECWCGPWIVRADDDVEIAKVMEIVKSGRSQADG
jgi:hypothetical protein